MTQFTDAGDIDMTGAALASLCVSGVSTGDSAATAGRNFLQGKLTTANGAFEYPFGINTNSNGWAVQGLNACGIPNQGADFTTDAGKTPLDYLHTQQLPGGGFRYQTGSTPASYASIDAVRALAGGGFAATPPVPNTPGASRFVGSTSFTSGTTSRLALIVNNNAGTLKVCSVPIAPAVATTTLTTVLATATAAGTPSCVTSFATTGGTITSINGLGNTGTTTWRARIDNGTAATATTTKVVTLGDTIGLKYGS